MLIKRGTKHRKKIDIVLKSKQNIKTSKKRKKKCEEKLEEKKKKRLKNQKSWKKE